MNTITLTLEATPENARKIAVLLSGSVIEPNEVVIPAEKLKEAIKSFKKAEPKDPAVPENMEAPKEKPAETPKDPTVPEKMEAPKPTLAMLRKKGVAMVRAGRNEELEALIKEFGGEKLSDIPEENYEAFYGKLEELI